jgi:hypothetical protein
LDAWLASDRDDPTPFDSEAYVLEELTFGEEFEDESEFQNRKGAEANQTGDEYILVTLILTSALFFAGISTVLKSLRVRVALLVVGAALFVGGSIGMLTFPITRVPSPRRQRAGVLSGVPPAPGWPCRIRQTHEWRSCAPHRRQHLSH